MAVFAKAVYAYAGSGQPLDLVFAAGTVLLVAEKTDDGWCRGFCQGKEGWFPSAYTQIMDVTALEQAGVSPSLLIPVLRSPEWLVYATEDNKLYYVNMNAQTTTWLLPGLSGFTEQNTASDELAALNVNPNALEGLKALHGKTQKSSEDTTNICKPRKTKMEVINGVTFWENGDEQKPLNPLQLSYVDHFWADQGDKTGYDVILDKHLNGKEAMKDMMELFRELAMVEEQYSKSLLKLFKSSLGEQEEGTLRNAWIAIKADLKCRADAHQTFATELRGQIEKPLLDFKEAQKKGRKEHQQIMEKSRKLLQSLDASIEKVLANSKLKLSKKNSRDEIQMKRRSYTTGDEIKRLEENYNIAQHQWIDDMINACQDYERQEDERSDYLKDLFFKYVELGVAVNEATAESMAQATDIVQRIDKKTDREHFIKTKKTGTLRPCDRVVYL